MDKLLQFPIRFEAAGTCTETAKNAVRRVDIVELCRICKAKTSGTAEGGAVAINLHRNRIVFYKIFVIIVVNSAE